MLRQPRSGSRRFDRYRHAMLLGQALCSADRAENIPQDFWLRASMAEALELQKSLGGALFIVACGARHDDQ
jgi:hypothetical protein